MFFLIKYIAVLYVNIYKDSLVLPCAQGSSPEAREDEAGQSSSPVQAGVTWVYKGEGSHQHGRGVWIGAAG